MKELFQIFRVWDVRLALPAAMVSLLGDAMAMVALTLRVHDSGAGPYAVALLLVCFSLPVVVTMGLVGHVADSVDPRLVLGAGGLVQVLACLGLATWNGLAATYALVVVLQTGFAFANPVWSSVLTRAVGDHHVGRLVSTQQALGAVAAPIGAALGGVLVELRGDSVVFVLDAATCAVLLVAGLAVRTRVAGNGRTAARRDDATRAAVSFLPRAGLAVVRADRVVWVLVCAMLPFVVSLESMNAVEVFLARDELHATQAQFGYWQALTGVGAVLGAVAAGVLRADPTRLRALVVALVAMSLAQVGSGLAPTLAWLFGFGAALGLANAVSNAALFAVFMRRTAPGDRGKALAVVNGMARTCTMLALGLGGVGASTIGPRGSFVVAGCCGVAVACWAGWSLHRIGALRAPGDAPAVQAARESVPEPPDLRKVHFQQGR
ncbi:MFS transporter [Pedococcus bigeumensis]|uniref:MFS transporter n=1 Tax=Pedococcus bigeumensis TaxID=433644 RepID=A0A502CW73_9MICO|nr:MFS transporter [Pedococcus bigeumensis]TPG16912.1 MFS transporter [Pedococcus bigeumensis]